MKRYLKKVFLLTASFQQKNHAEEATYAHNFAKNFPPRLNVPGNRAQNKLLSVLKQRHTQALCQIFASKSPLDNRLEIDYSRRRGSDNDFVKYLSRRAIKTVPGSRFTGEVFSPRSVR